MFCGASKRFGERCTKETNLAAIMPRGVSVYSKMLPTDSNSDCFESSSRPFSESLSSNCNFSIPFICRLLPFNVLYPCTVCATSRYRGTFVCKLCMWKSHSRSRAKEINASKYQKEIVLWVHIHTWLYYIYIYIRVYVIVCIIYIYIFICCIWLSARTEQASFLKAGLAPIEACDGKTWADWPKSHENHHVLKRTPAINTIGSWILPAFICCIWLSARTEQASFLKAGLAPIEACDIKYPPWCHSLKKASSHQPESICTHTFQWLLCCVRLSRPTHGPKTKEQVS